MRNSCMYFELIKYEQKTENVIRPTLLAPLK